MAKRNPNPIDEHVGSRLRIRRTLNGLSQESLGEQLDLTFQQIQKYEKGSNRISASRLYQISRILGVPVQFFFDDMPSSISEWGLDEGFAESSRAFSNDDGIMENLRSPDNIQLLQAFAEIKDAPVRRRILELVRAIGGADGDS